MYYAPGPKARSWAFGPDREIHTRPRRSACIFRCWLGVSVRWPMLIISPLYAVHVPHSSVFGRPGTERV